MNLPPSADSHVPVKEQEAKFRVGDEVFVRTYAGPIVRVRIVEVISGGFRGTTGEADNKRLFLAGVPDCPPGFVSTFHDHLVVTKKEYDLEVKDKWDVSEKRIKKQAQLTSQRRSP